MSERTPNRLTRAYLDLLDQARELVDESREALGLAEVLERAQKTAAEVRQFTHEEYEKVRYYLKRDLQDMLQHARRSEKDLADWLRMDLTLVEGKLLDLFTSVADPTKVELNELIASGFHAQDYATGEVAGPGVLECRECGRRLSFEEPAPIPACPDCRGTEFQRTAGGGL